MYSFEWDENKNRIREESIIRIISSRRANSSEIKNYERRIRP